MSDRKQKSKAEESKQQHLFGFKGNWAPKLECFTRLSADGRYVIHKTVITSIKPIRYVEKVLEGKNSVSRDAAPDSSDLKVEKKEQ